MTNEKKAAPAAKPVAAAKPPKKLIPRTAPKNEPTLDPILAEAAPVTVPDVATQPEVAPVVAPAPAVSATAAATAKARRVRKPTQEDETVARHQKVLAEALVMAQAINYEQPKVMRQAPAKGKKAVKPVKAKKIKLVRDSYAMPENEYAQIGELKKRLAAMSVDVKKSELLRGGIAVMAALNDAELKQVMARVERIKTGRPAK
jgi:hypothetical protein